MALAGERGGKVSRRSRQGRAVKKHRHRLLGSHYAAMLRQRRDFVPPVRPVNGAL
jgi:hypothetical protein